MVVWTTLQQIIGVLSTAVGLATAAYGLYRSLRRGAEPVREEQKGWPRNTLRSVGRSEEDDWYSGELPLCDAQSRRPHRGQLISWLGFASFLFPFPLGPVVWLLGNHDLQEMKAGRMDPEGAAATRTGRLCGKIATIGFGVLYAISLVFSVIVLTIIGFVIHSFAK
jgi:hypothetical protein